MRLITTKKYLKDLYHKLSNLNVTERKLLPIVNQNKVLINYIEQEVDIILKNIDVFKKVIELSGEKVKTLSKQCDDYSQKIKELEKELFNTRIMVPGNFPVDEVMKSCIEAVKNNDFINKTRTFKALENDEYYIIFKARIIDDDVYCNVYKKDKEELITLYKVNSVIENDKYKKNLIGNIDDLHKFFKENKFKYKEVYE